MQKLIEIFNEIEKHLMEDLEPSEYLNSLIDQGTFGEYPFSMLSGLIKIEQSQQHHPEGNVWRHTMMVLDNAALRRNLSKDSRVFMWSALLHDLGKAPATKIRKGKITAYDHDKLGEDLAIHFLKEFDQEQDFINKVAAMVRWHMQILYVVKNLPFANIKGMLSQVPIEEIALLSLCDRMGRGEMDNEKILEEEENVRVFIEKCKNNS